MDRRFGRIAGLVMASALALAVAAPVGAADTSKVRVLHASPDAPAVDVYLDDTIVGALTAVPFGVISGYLDIPSGDHNIKVYATGDTTSPVIDADVTVAAGKAYTIAATDAVASISAQVIEDAPSASCDTAQVRVIHFSADAPAVDVATAGSDPADAVVKNLSYPDATGYLDLPAGSYDLEVRLAGTTTVALDLPGVAIEDCKSYSVFAIGSAASPAVGGNALQVVVAVDATASASGGTAPTPPATDTIGSAGSSDSAGLGLTGALMLVGAIAIASAGTFTLLSRRVRND
jgi:hypothetical protein